MKELVKDWKNACNNLVDFTLEKEGLYRIKVPFYHEDGDMMDLFLKTEGGLVLTDYGMTLMKLSYMFELDTDEKREILNKILKYNGLSNNEGELTKKTQLNRLGEDINQFCLTIAKILNMEYFFK